jgi:cell wall assembly regulator SMI1
MKLPIISTDFPKAQKIDIKRAETELQCNFPEMFKEYLLMHNGGSVGETTNSFSMVGTDDDAYVLDRLYPVRTASMPDKSHIVYENNHLWGDIPEGVVSFGCGPFGDEVCIGVKKDNFGKIYWWLHDQDEDSAAILIADSLASYFEQLYPYSDFNQTELEVESVWILPSLLETVSK